MADEVGPLVNHQSPDFELYNDTEQLTSLDSLLGTRGALLAFIHGTWCAGCVQTIHQLQRYARTYADSGVQVAVIAIDPPYRLNTFKLSASTPVPFPMLADESGAVHTLYNLEKLTAYVLVDNGRSVKAKFVDAGNHILPGHRTLMEAIKQHLS